MGTSESIQASSGSVKDCIQDEDCLEGDDAPARDNPDSNKDAPADDSLKSGSLVISLVKMALALILVLGLIYGLLKFVNKRNKLFPQAKTLENVGGISVGPNKSIQLVRIGQKVYVVGVGDNVELLQEVTDEEQKKELLGNEHTKASDPSSLWKSVFQQKNSGHDTNKPTNEFRQLFSAELEKLRRTRRTIISRRSEKDD
ncbi:flagellar protein [Lentibacillus cibarius]|uniref:Flagellar protein n=2 Tax=Lentibacillus cibarius TaxID=2583219 RepID=A0A549YN01_9BACI|nr:flagellar protein [Lentibacillus cibarius]TRM13272.1 flagellar protein [Lentibacillus cibarius]